MLSRGSNKYATKPAELVKKLVRTFIHEVDAAILEINIEKVEKWSYSSNDHEEKRQFVVRCAVDGTEILFVKIIRSLLNLTRKRTHSAQGDISPVVSSNRPAPLTVYAYRKKARIVLEEAGKGMVRGASSVGRSRRDVNYNEGGDICFCSDFQVSKEAVDETTWNNIYVLLNEEMDEWSKEVQLMGGSIRFRRLGDGGAEGKQFANICILLPMDLVITTDLPTSSHSSGANTRSPSISTSSSSAARSSSVGGGLASNIVGIFPIVAVGVVDDTNNTLSQQQSHAFPNIRSSGGSNNGNGDGGLDYSHPLSIKIDPQGPADPSSPTSDVDATEISPEDTNLSETKGALTPTAPITPPPSTSSGSTPKPRSRDMSQRSFTGVLPSPTSVSSSTSTLNSTSTSPTTVPFTATGASFHVDPTSVTSKTIMDTTVVIPGESKALSVIEQSPSSCILDLQEIAPIAGSQDMSLGDNSNRTHANTYPHTHAQKTHEQQAHSDIPSTSSVSSASTSTSSRPISCRSIAPPSHVAVSSFSDQASVTTETKQPLCRPKSEAQLQAQTEAQNQVQSRLQVEVQADVQFEGQVQGKSESEVQPQPQPRPRLIIETSATSTTTAPADAQQEEEALSPTSNKATASSSSSPNQRFALQIPSADTNDLPASTATPTSAMAAAAISMRRATTTPTPIIPLTPTRPTISKISNQSIRALGSFISNVSFSGKHTSHNNNGGAGGGGGGGGGRSRHKSPVPMSGRSPRDNNHSDFAGGPIPELGNCNSTSLVGVDSTKLASGRTPMGSSFMSVANTLGKLLPTFEPSNAPATTSPPAQLQSQLQSQSQLLSQSQGQSMRRGQGPGQNAQQQHQQQQPLHEQAVVAAVRLARRSFSISRHRTPTPSAAAENNDDDSNTNRNNSSYARNKDAKAETSLRNMFGGNGDGGGGSGGGGDGVSIRSTLSNRKLSVASAPNSVRLNPPNLGIGASASRGSDSPLSRRVAIAAVGNSVLDALNAESEVHSEDKEKEEEAMEALEALEEHSDLVDSIGEDIVSKEGTAAVATGRKHHGKSQLEKIFSRFGRRHSSIVGSYFNDSVGRTSSGHNGGGTGLTFLEELEARRRMLAKQSTLGGEEGLQRRFLIVDDCPVTRKVVRRLLMNQGQLVGEAVNGLDCLRVYEEAIIRGEEFDVILMDEDMPMMCGNVAAKMLRSRGATVPILGLSGGDKKFVTQLFKDSGVLVVLQKPLDMVQLEAALTRYYEVEEEQSPPLLLAGASPLLEGHIKQGQGQARAQEQEYTPNSTVTVTAMTETTVELSAGSN